MSNSCSASQCLHINTQYLLKSEENWKSYTLGRHSRVFPILRIEYNQKPRDYMQTNTRRLWQVERRQSSSGPWNPRHNTMMNSLGFLFASCIPDLEMKKSVVWECQRERTRKAPSTRQENLGPILRKGIEDPLSIRHWGRVHRAPLLIFFLWDSLTFKRESLSYL